MSGVKLFRKQDQDFRFESEEPYSILAFVNSSITDTMGGGMGVFGAGSDVEWTVTYDELLFIHSGHFTLKVGEAVYRAGPGDTLWIPRDTPLSYVAEEDVWSLCQSGGRWRPEGTGASHFGDWFALA